MCGKPQVVPKGLPQESESKNNNDYKNNAMDKSSDDTDTIEEFSHENTTENKNQEEAIHTNTNDSLHAPSYPGLDDCNIRAPTEVQGFIKHTCSYSSFIEVI